MCVCIQVSTPAQISFQSSPPADGKVVVRPSKSYFDATHRTPAYSTQNNNHHEVPLRDACKKISTSHCA